MSSTPYLTLSGTNLALQDLIAQIETVLAGNLTDLTLTNELILSGAVSGAMGRLRFNEAATPASLEYSNDGGINWYTLKTVNYTWVNGQTYAVGSFVIYGSAWYVCTTATSNAIPGTSTAWRLLTLGSMLTYVHTTAQLQTALETTDTSATILLAGTFTGALTATVTCPNIVIYSDETTEIQNSSISITGVSDGNIYWHSNGTMFNPGTDTTATLTISTGTLWIERATVSTGTLALTGTVKYQRIDGAITGGTQIRWTEMNQTSSYVPRDITTLSQASYADSLNFYVYDSAGKYITANTLLTQMAAKAAIYFTINATGLLANKPAEASQGYAYYATDTGDVYVMGASNVWSSGVHIQGPQGVQGSSGNDGSDGVSPSVTITSTTNGSTITITDATHPSGQTITLTNGAAGTTPTINIGTTQTLAAGAAATVSASTSGNAVTLNFGIPKGSDGTNIYTVNTPLSMTDNSISLVGYPTVPITVGAASMTVTPGNVYDITTAITGLTLTISGTAGTFGESWIRVLFGESASITEVSGSSNLTITNATSLTAGATNLLHIVFWGTTARLTVMEHWT